MMKHSLAEQLPCIETLQDLASLADYSMMDALNCDPDATLDGRDHSPREVLSGHYVPVQPTPIQSPEYVAHGKALFDELGLIDDLARSADFMRLFSGDISAAPAPMRATGWACGYALSIFGQEYTRQCPFQTGNGYGDGRAISILEAVIRGKRWEMQLKGGGRTPYCRGGDGRAVLRSSVREFLAQEHMHALGVPTSRSLSLYVSRTEKAQRAWYSEGSTAVDPDRMVSEPVAISTRVAPSFIRVGQLELFLRRVRSQSHPEAMNELRMIVSHAIRREYAEVIDQGLGFDEQLIAFAREFRDRLTSLVADWVRVGYCQGNFNSDNCAVGGFTLDYGPFGFCEIFDPYYQPWTGGGRHFAFFSQPLAAEKNFGMFCSALRPLFLNNQAGLSALDELQDSFAGIMQEKMENMWASKLGLNSFDAALFIELMELMVETPVDYTMFFRELSGIPEEIGPLKKSFYADHDRRMPGSEMSVAASDARWSAWLRKWRTQIGVGAASLPQFREKISAGMKQINPKYAFREWLVVPAYQQAAIGDYSVIREMQDVMMSPYAEQSKDVEEKYYRIRPVKYFDVGGVSHYSCSS